MLDDLEDATAVMTAECGRPLQFTVRPSARARRVRLTVSPQEGLVVVVPAGWHGNPGWIVESKRGWAEQALATVAERRALLLAGPEALLPDAVHLPAVGMRLPVEYLYAPGARRMSVAEEGDTLVVKGDVEDASACLAALRRWLGRKARRCLPPLVLSHAEETGLLPSSVRITSARTRWGSCSARGTVSLNRSVLFLPPDLAEAVVLHELAHLKVLDHSPRFWALLSSLDPGALEHRRRLRKAGDMIPPWADA